MTFGPLVDNIEDQFRISCIIDREGEGRQYDMFCLVAIYGID